MLTASRLGRRVLGGSAVSLASVLSMFLARGLQSNAAEDSPAFRQKGSLKAPIVIVEYSDFQCPSCRMAEEPLNRLLALYGHKVGFVYKHFPLDQHPLSKAASIASECAGSFGQFWPFHDRLYEKQSEWPQDNAPAMTFARYAKELGLNDKAFADCLSDPSIRKAVEADIEEGKNRWVGSTPTFFVNQKRFVGGLQLSIRGTPWIEKLLKTGGPKP